MTKGYRSDLPPVRVEWDGFRGRISQREIVHTVPWLEGEPLSGDTVRMLLTIADLINEEPGVNAAVLIDALALGWEMDWDACEQAVRLVIELAMVEAYPDPSLPVGMA